MGVIIGRHPLTPYWASSHFMALSGSLNIFTVTPVSAYSLIILCITICPTAFSGRTRAQYFHPALMTRGLQTVAVHFVSSIPITELFLSSDNHLLALFFSNMAAPALNPSCNVFPWVNL